MGNDDSSREWGTSAVYWDRHLDTIRVMFAPVTRALLDEAGVRAGHHVLDVAGGSGEPSLSISESVGLAGRVQYTDIDSRMAEAAAGHATRLGLGNIAFCQGSGDSLPFPDRAFDAVVCRFGVMFFPDPKSGVREMLRVARPGARVSAAVWHHSASNPYFSIVTDILDRYVRPEAVDPEAPGAFRFAESGKLESVFAEAGAGDVRQRLLAFDIRVPGSVDDFWTLRSDLSDTLRGKLAKLSSATADRIADEVRSAAAKFVVNGGLRFPARVIVVSGEARPDH